MSLATRGGNRLVLLALVGLAMACSSTDEGSGGSTTSSFVERASLAPPGRALAADGQSLIASIGDGIAVSDDEGRSWQKLATSGLPPGPVVALTAAPPALLAQVWGEGLYRSTDEGVSWARVATAPQSPLLSALNPRGQVIPFDFACDQAVPQRIFAAAVGGLYRSSDAGASWETLAAATRVGVFNVLFTGVATRGNRVVAASIDPVSLTPSAFAGLLQGGVFASDDGGDSWRDITGDIPAAVFSDVAFDAEGNVYVAALDGGVYRRDGAAWTSIGGPEDAVRVSFDGAAINVGSTSRGVWRLEDGVWTQAGDAPIAGLTARHALTSSGIVLAAAPERGAEPPPHAGGTVYVALSFHANLYHSFRGDSNDDSGYGLDIRVIRTILDWLDRFPETHGDWDIENAFSLDGVLPREAPDIIERIRARVTEGTDGLRLMSWNNGAVASETREEFDASIQWAKDSYLAAFGTFDPGVQPQEHMFSPDHIGWYRANGIEWVTLFNSATPFTALPLEIELEPGQRYNPFTINDGADEMVAVPVYHHADMLDHGGMRGWVRQLAAAAPGDSLLVIHMDADSEFWVNFELELEALQGEPSVRFTTIQDYLDTHPPRGRVEIAGDLADGLGDGFQSWAEKHFNHEIYTGIARARRDVDVARALAGDDSTVAALADASLRPRLLSLSTTHFGLAAPFLVEDRVATARARVAEAQETAAAARTAAEDAVPLAPGTIEIVNTRGAAGPALVEIPFSIAADRYDGVEGLVVRDEDGDELPVAILGTIEEQDRIEVRTALLVDVEPRQRRLLAWAYDPARPSAVTGANGDDLSVPLALALPFTECGGETSTAELREEGAPQRDPRGVRVARERSYALAYCDAGGSVEQRIAAYDGLPGLVLHVAAEIGSATDPLSAESVALSPLACDGALDSITWPTFGGEVRTRPARPGQETWNGHSADGWIALHCADGKTLSIAHRVAERTSLGFAPLRTKGDHAIVAPLGTLWGDPPWHDARRIGGLGVGDILTGAVGSQFRPSAPDWSGKTVRYTLLIGSVLDPDTLELFAHPPAVRVR